MSRRKALITGITGQDGSYLAELLLSKGYEVHGLVRRVALEDPANRLRRLDAARDRIILHAGSLESFPSLHQIVRRGQPDEGYHQAPQSFVTSSFMNQFPPVKTNINRTHFFVPRAKKNTPPAPF